MDILRPPSGILAALPAFEKHLSVIKGSGAKTAKRYSGYVAAFNGFFMQRLKEARKNKGPTEPAESGPHNPGRKSPSRGTQEEGVKLAAVRQTDIDDWLKHLFFTGNTANVTRSTKLSALRQFWRFLIYSGLVIHPKYAIFSARALFISMPVSGEKAELVETRRVPVPRTGKRLSKGGVRVFVHKMRSTFATGLYDEGHGLKEISIVMGHSSVAITERYVSISEKVLQQTMISMRRWKIILGGIDET